MLFYIPHPHWPVKSKFPILNYFDLTKKSSNGGKLRVV